MKIQLLSLAMIALGLTQQVAAQESTASSDTLAPIVEQVQTDIKLMKKLTISGYVQAQAQRADSAGIASVAGGNFDKDVNSRFGVRRGRLKFAYTGSNGLTQAVVQFDITEKQFATKDVYLKATDPLLKTFTLTGGVFNRPFGYEIEYSSSLRESPERSRIVQTLFPGERDMGFMLTIQAPKTSRFNFVKLDVGAFNGVGPTAIDYDKYKDVISHLSFTKSLLQERLKVSGGVSGYFGGWRNMNGSLFSDVTVNDAGVGVFSETKTGIYNTRNKRQYLGADLQVTFDFPFGITTVRAEYIQGEQPAYQDNVGSVTALAQDSKTVADTKTGAVSTTSTYKNTYSRSVRGGYVYLVQNIGQTRFQIVGKIDYFDPNTKVSGSQIASTLNSAGKLDATSLTAADVAYTTFGFGLNVKLSENLKMMAYYDIVKNEKTGIVANKDLKIGNYTSDLKDNVATLRFQYKF